VQGDECDYSFALAAIGWLSKHPLQLVLESIAEGRKDGFSASATIDAMMTMNIEMT
jgi:hypothetical protein